MMQMKLPLACAALLASGCLAEARTIATEERDLSVGSAEALRFEVGDGDLEVLGDPSAASIAVTVRLRTHSPIGSGDDAARAALVVRLEREGDEAVLVVAVEGADGYFADVLVTLPSGLPVSGRDGSGDVRVEGVASLALDDDSGGVIVRDVAGEVLLDDASGDVDVRGTGPVALVDGTGDLRVAEVDGDVVLEDESGEIEVTDASGAVDITDDSGGIVVRRVAGRVTVRDGSGDIDVSDVGSFELVEDGSGGVTQR